VLRTYAGAGRRLTAILAAASASMAPAMDSSPATKLPRQPSRHHPAS